MKQIDRVESFVRCRSEVTTWEVEKWALTQMGISSGSATRHLRTLLLDFEDILAIESEPEMSCEKINKAIKDVNSALNLLKSVLKSAQYIENQDETREDIITEIESAEYDISDLEDAFEFCRSQCEKIRAWGEQWKAEAIKALMKYEPETLSSAKE